MKTIEEIQTQLDEIQKDLNVIKSHPSQEEDKIKTTIEVGGLKFALHNLGTDMDNPYGKFYSWYEAKEACPKGWRLPTQEEWVKFNKSTTHEWVENKETINGMKFTDKVTGKSIFLPAMGWNNPHKKGDFDYVGTIGFYWSFARYSDVYRAYNFYNLYFDCNGIIKPSDCHLCTSGFSVRYIKD